jgi:protein-L-isoaspartate(D-aspartate) O-methyltransferase
MSARWTNGDAEKDPRQQMLRRDLRGRGIRDERVLTVMQKVQREEFVPPEDFEQAYADRALPIECGQTISQPYMVAVMTEALQLKGDEHVLEIGTGSGYQTAVLAELAAQVTSIERHAALSQQAEKRLQRLGYNNVRLLVGDGAKGAAEFAPFDRILITAAASECPPRLWEQLREGGILVGPFGSDEMQWLHSMHKVGGRQVSTSLVACRFVPFVADED